MTQLTLFDGPSSAMPPGWRYEDGFLTAQEEAALLALVRGLPLQAARYKSYTARRRVVSYGGSFDYDANRLQPAQPLVESLHGLRARVADWMGVAPERLAHVLVAEYPPGAPLGWHRDVPDFEDVAGVSLGSPAVLRFRPYPPQRPSRRDILRADVLPRSIYLMQGAARWDWQHSVAPLAAPRWSITFRTLAGRRPSSRAGRAARGDAPQAAAPADLSEPPA
ncbi:alpha-ketoglutarate-dependent dioxygenase AlkB [Bordetella bronchialis]|uniref:2OG-Fe(II) oxygenase n=1 Tax=Bordetella bronchialis TaxID=463025 RepID=A0ABM6CPF9_9BORD|nr:alpha-ketoglutarate-dependent dioxygenase AlkB [Bordetella bronchialis]ANN65857.1 2OG-Fe(II) oxygenase [Bordetella bronchialis]